MYKAFRDEIKLARKAKTFRAAFGSIVRRNPQLIDATKQEIDRFCQAIGAEGYYTEAKKTLNEIKYDLAR